MAGVLGIVPPWPERESTRFCQLITSGGLGEDVSELPNLMQRQKAPLRRGRSQNALRTTNHAKLGQRKHHASDVSVPISGVDLLPPLCSISSCYQMPKG